MSEDYTHPVHNIEFDHDEPAEHLPANAVFEYLATNPHMEQQRHPGARLDLARKLGLLSDKRHFMTVHFTGASNAFYSWRTQVNKDLISAANEECADLIDLPNAQMVVGGPDSVAGRLLPFLYQSEGDVRGAVKAYELAREDAEIARPHGRGHRDHKKVGAV